MQFIKTTFILFLIGWNFIVVIIILFALKKKHKKTKQKKSDFLQGSNIYKI